MASGSRSKARSSGRSTPESSVARMARRVMSPSRVRLLPVAKTAALLGTSALTDLPRMRTFRLVWVRVWHRSSPPSGSSQLSMAISTSPAISAAPSRFSISSSDLPCAITGAGRAVAIRLARSTSMDLPVPAVGALKPWSGAVGSERRISAVRIAESATERSASVTKGKVEIRSLRKASARRAVSRSGSRGSAGNWTSCGSNSSPVCAS